MGLSQGALWAYNSEPVDLIVFFLRNQAEAFASASNLLFTEMWRFSSPRVPTSPPQSVFTVESIFFYFVEECYLWVPSKTCERIREQADFSTILGREPEEESIWNRANAEGLIAQNKAVMAWWVKVTLSLTFLSPVQPKGLKVKHEH